MASWPLGVQLTSLQFDGSFSATATTDITTTVLVELVLEGTDLLTWTATGDQWEQIFDTYTNPDTIPWPFSDQPGFVDAGGHSYTGFGAKLTITRQAGGQRTTHVRFVQPVTGQTTIAVSSLTDDSIGSPTYGQIPAVTSVNGQTGAVVISGGGASGVNVPFTNTSSINYPHTFGRIPNVQFVDSTGQPFYTDYTPTASAVMAIFPAPATGVMVLS